MKLNNTVNPATADFDPNRVANNPAVKPALKDVKSDPLEFFQGHLDGAIAIIFIIGAVVVITALTGIPAIQNIGLAVLAGSLALFILALFVMLGIGLKRKFSRE